MVNRLTLPLADWVGAASLNQATDAQLLHRFSQLGEQQAFTILVKRHGPMVWGVIRRVLPGHQDAEDAFQAVFLVLTRKAGSLRQPHLLAAWLHGVAHRTALFVRRKRKLTLPLDAVGDLPGILRDDVAWRDSGQLIDRSIEQLPMSLRIVFLLCQVEGLTSQAAGKRLNIPEGTVDSRLYRARRQLQNLLARHGITSAAGAVAASWSLGLPESLSALTVRSLLGSTPPAIIAGLAQGVLTTMLWIKVSTAAVLVSTLGLVGIGSATIVAQGSGDKVALQTGVAQPPAKGAAKEDRIKQLEAQLAELRDREMMMRQQLDEQRKKTEAVQKFLERALATEQKAKVNEADMARERKEAEARNYQDKMIEEKSRRRVVDLMKAKEQLVQEMEHLQKEHEAIEAKHLMILAEQQDSERKAEALQQQFAARAAAISGTDDKLKDLKARRDAEMEQSRAKQAMINASSNIVTSMTRLKTQLKLRDKLLLEVEEKLLRMQLKLDEK